MEVLTEIARAEDRHATVEDRRAELVARMRSADEGLEVGQSEAQRVDTEQSSLEEGLRNLLAERDRLMGLHRTALDNHEQRRIEAREAAEALLEAREAREARRSRLDSLEELVERRDELLAGTRHLLEQSAGTRDHQGLKGLVRDVLEVDREAERAVEAVLADCAGAIIVDRPEGALEALDLLRSTTSGRGMFVAPTSAREVPSGFVPLGEPLLAKVRPRPGYEDVARRLLSDVNVVKSLSEVLDVYGNGRIPCAFVTLEGDLLTPDGVLTGGSHGNSGTGLITRMGEIRDLQREVADLEARVQGLEARHGEAEQELSDLLISIDTQEHRDRLENTIVRLSAQIDVGSRPR